MGWRRAVVSARITSFTFSREFLHRHLDFLRHSFLVEIFERTPCARRRTGWQRQQVRIECVVRRPGVDKGVLADTNTAHQGERLVRRPVLCLHRRSGQDQPGEESDGADNQHEDAEVPGFGFEIKVLGTCRHGFLRLVGQNAVCSYLI